MICKTCNESGVLSSANGQDFYYCRNCKVEILLEESIRQKEEGATLEFASYPVWRVASEQGNGEAQDDSGELFMITPTTLGKYFTLDFGSVNCKHDFNMDTATRIYWMLMHLKYLISNAENKGANLRKL